MKPLTSLGISDFRNLIEANRYFVDKSLLIRDVFYGAGTILFARPRRFGKTLNMSMLRYFYDLNAGDNAHLFRGLAIEKETAVMAKQGKHPVIFLSLKDVKGATWELTFEGISAVIHAEVLRFAYLLESEKLSEHEKAQFSELINQPASRISLERSLKTISALLARHHQSKTVIIIDEYDSPIHTAWLGGFYTEALSFFRNFLSGGLKDNEHLEKGVLTGILRVARESIFSGLNNFDNSTVITFNEFSDKFGFTIPEVQKMIADYGMNGKEWQEIEEWYNGYRFGREVIFNPWSILNYVKAPDNGTQPYWVNTSDNAILKRLFFKGKSAIIEYLEALLRGEKITLGVSDNVVFQDLDDSQETVWSLLLHSGYLRYENVRQAGTQRLFDLSLPNREVEFVYQEIIKRWLREDVKANDHDRMLAYLTNGELLPFEKYLRTFVEQVFSYHDVQRGLAENFYHAFLLGMFARLEPWYVILSNRESGYGRYDLCLMPREKGKKGIVIEIKAPVEERGETLDDALAAAETQVKTKKYEAQLTAHGIAEVLRLAIAVQGKQVKVKEV